MDSFEKFRSDFWQRMGAPPNGREGFIGGLRRAAEIGLDRVNRARTVDYRAGARHLVQDIEEEARRIEGE